MHRIATINSIFLFALLQLKEICMIELFSFQEMYMKYLHNIGHAESFICDGQYLEDFSFYL